MIEPLRALIARPRLRTVMLSLFTGVGLCLWAIMVRVFRGPETVNRFGWSLTSLMLAYLGSCTLVGCVVAATQSFAMESDLAAAGVGALTGAVVLPAFFLPTSSLHEWTGMLAWLVGVGILGGAYGGVRLRSQVEQERADASAE